MITVYGVAQTRAGRVLWALEELGLRYERKMVAPRDEFSMSAAYRAINPSGKVPAITDGDLVMTESLAINLYLAQTYGAGTLWPAGKADQAHCMQWTLWTAMEVEPYVSAVLFEKFIKARFNLGAPDMHVANAAEERVKSALPIIEGHLKGREWMLGSGFTITDINTSAIMELLGRLNLDLASYPNTQHWLAACLARPARQKVLAFKE